MLGHLAAILAFRLSTRLPKVLGVLPARFYVGEAVRCLRRDDLDGAMACYRTAKTKDAEADEVKVLYEVLSMEIKHRRLALGKRRDVLQRTMTAGGRKTKGLGTHLTMSFCETELNAAERALEIIDRFAAELEGRRTAEAREGRPVN